MTDSRYVEAYPDLFSQHDDRVRRLVEQVLGSTHDGRLWPEQEVKDVIDRVTGRISFEEYRHRGRRVARA